MTRDSSQAPDVYIERLRRERDEARGALAQIRSIVWEFAGDEAPPKIDAEVEAVRWMGQELVTLHDSLDAAYAETGRREVELDEVLALLRAAKGRHMDGGDWLRRRDALLAKMEAG